MAYRERVQKSLQGVSREFSVAFATRAALRALPFFAVGSENRGPFWYWKVANRDNHLLAVLSAQRFGFAFSANASEHAIPFAAQATANAVYSAYADAYPPTENAYLHASRATAYAAHAYAANAYTADTSYTPAAHAARAARASRDAAIATDKTHPSIELRDIVVKANESDLDAITGHSRGNLISVVLFLETPLWPSREIPEQLRPHWERFSFWAKSLNAGFGHWLIWVQDRVSGKAIDLDLLKKQVNIPSEIRSQAPIEVNAYLENMENPRSEKGLRALNLVRAIFIGNGGVGKTSLIRVLNGEAVVKGVEKMTPGIEIRNWLVEKTGITAKFWDFGGQVMSHATHQFFLRERCLYVLVLNARSEINANEEAEYWLEHVKAFGKDAAVMLVENKADELPVSLDQGALREKYPNIVGFYPLSCTEATGIKKYKRYFETFRDDLIAQLQQVGTHQIYFTPAQFHVLKAVQQKSPESAFLSQDEFDALCQEQGIGTEGVQNRAWLLDLLDKLGEVIHFPELMSLNGFVLNPRWLTYGVYTLLYSKELEQNRGNLSKAEVVTILSREKVTDEKGHVLTYPKDKCAFILEAMRKFKLCYPFPGEEGRFVIPDKLPSNQPNLTFITTKAGTLAFEFAFSGFLPRHIMPSFIVSFHEEIDDGLVWQNGVILKNEREHARARVQVDYHKRLLKIWVQGTGKREMLAVLSAGVSKILKRMEGLDYEERVVLPQSARLGESFGRVEIEKASYHQLLAMAQEGQRTYITGSKTKYDLGKILGEIMTEERQKQEGMRIHVENSPGATITLGDENEVSVKTSIKQVAIKSSAVELDAILKKFRLEISKLDVGKKEGLEEEKLEANDELQEIRKHLKNIENPSAEQKSKLGSFLSNIKNKILSAIALAKGFEASADTIQSLIQKAEALSRHFFGIPF